MKRRVVPARPDWQGRVEEVGLSFHTINGETYWDESACYELTAAEVDTLEEAANELHLRCLDAAQAVIDRNWWSRLSIPDKAITEIKESWNREDFSIYGRFDFAWDGVTAPKLLEYNADTPTALLEAAVVQWQWLQEVEPDADQFNSIHERLIEAWKKVPAECVHFCFVDDMPEDEQTTLYLQDTCTQAGKETVSLTMNGVGWNERAKRFVDAEKRFIDTAFKLYPWEWLWHEDFATHLPGRTKRFVEPVWKMLLSNKALLPILWELFPNHPNLVPSFDQPDSLNGSYVAKPKLSREGANITIMENGKVVAETGGPYGAEGFVYQAPALMAEFDGQYPVFGLWMIAGEAAGLGIREDTSRITSNASRFVPHLFR